MSAIGEAAAGFTLLEMLATLTITAMAGTLVFAGVERALPMVTLLEARQVVISDVRLARARAIAGGQPQAIAILEDGRAYGWTSGAERRLPLETRLRASGGQVAFFPDGSAWPGDLTLIAGNRATAFHVDQSGSISNATVAAAGG
jgi:general secretion pathway protein H